MDKKSVLIVFTDGACKGNGKYYAKAGVGVHFPNKELHDISEKFTLKPITNQRSELWAMSRALTEIINSGLMDKKKKIIVYSDSKYTILTLTKWASKWEKNNWLLSNGDKVKNKDLIIPLYEMYYQYRNKIKIIHVMAHTEQEDDISVGNQEADRLANEGIYKTKV